MTHADYLAMSRFPALDGLRAIAALLVLVHHFGGPRWIVLSGWVGVYLFFVLSGFLITTLALREEERHGRLSLRSFYIRRVFRIMPVYFLLLGVTVLVYSWLGQYDDLDMASALPYYLTFNGEFVGLGHGYDLSWTLGIEEKFYLVWPLLAFAIPRLSVRYRVLLATVASAGVQLLPLPGPSIPYAVIMFGCLLAIALHDRRGFAVLRWLTSLPAALTIVAGFILIHLVVPRLAADVVGEAKTIVVYGAGCVVLVLATLGRNPVSTLLSTGPFGFVGRRSYSLYLVQQLAALAVVAIVPVLATPGTGSLLAVSVVALICADILYRWVESPGIRLGRRLIQRIQHGEKRHLDSPSDVAATPAEPGSLLPVETALDGTGERRRDLGVQPGMT
jgi:peptidoglycan/LPS O-acetylase OafA/YrhL